MTSMRSMTIDSQLEDAGGCCRDAVRAGGELTPLGRPRVAWAAQAAVTAGYVQHVSANLLYLNQSPLGPNMPTYLGRELTPLEVEVAPGKLGSRGCDQRG